MAAIDDIGIDEDGVLGNSLLDFPLSCVDLAQHLVYIQVLRRYIDHVKAFFSSWCQ